MNRQVTYRGSSSLCWTRGISSLHNIGWLLWWFSFKQFSHIVMYSYICWNSCESYLEAIFQHWYRWNRAPCILLSQCLSHPFASHNEYHRHLSSMTQSYLFSPPFHHMSCSHSLRPTCIPCGTTFQQDRDEIESPLWYLPFTIFYGHGWARYNLPMHHISKFWFKRECILAVLKHTNTK